MKAIYWLALWQLLRFEYLIRRRDFASLYTRVRQYPRHSESSMSGAIDEICKAVDVLCIFYPKQVLCLQRSAATTCLLKRYGVRAQMAIGAQQSPFRAHAWVEVDGRVVNDKSCVAETYPVVDRC